MIRTPQWLHWPRMTAWTAILVLLLGAAVCGAAAASLLGRRGRCRSRASAPAGGGRLIARSPRRYRHVLSRAGVVPTRRGCRDGAAGRARRTAGGQGGGGGGAVAVTYDNRSFAYLSGSGGNRYGRLGGDDRDDHRRRPADIAATRGAAGGDGRAGGAGRDDRGSLDRYSRYASPDLARDQRAARNGWGGIGDHGRSARTICSASPRSSRRARPIAPASGRRTRSSRSTGSRPRVRASGSRRPAARPGRQPGLGRIVPAGVAQPRELQLQRAYVFEPTVTASRERRYRRVAGQQLQSRTTTRRSPNRWPDAQRQAGGRLAGIVLDLRSNPGGVLDQAVSLADLFLRQGPIVSVVGRHPASRQYFTASGRSTVRRCLRWSC